MKNKKLIPLFALGAVAALASCSGGDGGVNVFIYQYSDTYITTVRTVLAEEFEKKGIDATFQDAANVQQTQTQQIDAAIAAGSSLLVVNTVDVATGEDVAEKAKNANIPVVFFNREVDDAAVRDENAVFVGTDPDEAGYMQGEIIAQALINDDNTLNTAWDTNGDGVINYVLLRAEPGNPEADGRTTYSVQEANRLLKAAGLSELHELTAPFNANWSRDTAQQTMANWISQYGMTGANAIELVIANNDDMALGAIAALQTAQYNLADGVTGELGTVLVVGVDATAAGVSAIDEGSMYGTVRQDGQAMAECIATLVENKLAGKGYLDGTDYKYDSDSVHKIRIPYGMYTA